MKQGFFSRLTRTPAAEGPNAVAEAPVLPPAPPVAAIEEIVRGIARQGLSMPARKAAISLRLDADVLDWFKAQGGGYQTRINAVLRAYMEAAG